jgi:hypothetical protein
MAYRLCVERLELTRWGTDFWATVGARLNPAELIFNGLTHRYRKRSGLSAATVWTPPFSSTARWTVGRCGPRRVGRKGSSACGPKRARATSSSAAMRSPVTTRSGPLSWVAPVVNRTAGELPRGHEPDVAPSDLPSLRGGRGRSSRSGRPMRTRLPPPFLARSALDVLPAVAHFDVVYGPHNDLSVQQKVSAASVGVARASQSCRSRRPARLPRARPISPAPGEAS